MPFPEQTPRAFSRVDIEALRPDQMGVYGLFKKNQWIYVGSGDVRDRLLAHFDGDNTCISREQPDEWVGEVTANYVQREKDLILELSPVCNQRVG